MDLTTRQLIDRDRHAHEHHLCRLVSERQMARVANLARDGQYICHICGRVANKADNLCEPTKL